MPGVGRGVLGEGGQAAMDRAKRKPVGDRGLTWDTGEPLGSTVAGAQVHGPPLVCWSCAALRR